MGIWNYYKKIIKNWNVKDVSLSIISKYITQPSCVNLLQKELIQQLNGHIGCINSLSVTSVHTHVEGWKAVTDILMVSCQKGPTCHAYPWQIGPFWQDTLNMFTCSQLALSTCRPRYLPHGKINMWYLCILWKHKGDYVTQHDPIPKAQINAIPDSKVHGANMGPIWGRQDPGGPHVGPMNFAVWDQLLGYLFGKFIF